MQRYNRTACTKCGPVSHDHHMILTWLSHDSHMTITWLSHDSHMTHMTHMTITWLSHDSHMTHMTRMTQMTLTWLTHDSHDSHMTHVTLAWLSHDFHMILTHKGTGVQLELLGPTCLWVLRLWDTGRSESCKNFKPVYVRKWTSLPSLPPPNTHTHTHTQSQKYWRCRYLLLPSKDPRLPPFYNSHMWKVEYTIDRHIREYWEGISIIGYIFMYIQHSSRAVPISKWLQK